MLYDLQATENRKAEAVSRIGSSELRLRGQGSFQERADLSGVRRRILRGNETNIKQECLVKSQVDS